MTVLQAAVKVLRDHGSPMTVAEIHDAIVAANLFTFKAKSPHSIVSKQIRRHCVDVTNRGSSDQKYFTLSGQNRYQLNEAGNGVQLPAG